MAIVADFDNRITAFVQAGSNADFRIVLGGSRLAGIPEQIQKYRFNEVPIGKQIQFCRGNRRAERNVVLRRALRQRKPCYISKKLTNLKSFLFRRCKSRYLAITVNKLSKTT